MVQIENDSYLIIVWGDKNKEVSINKFDTNTVQNTNNFLNNANLINTSLKQKVTNVLMAGWTSPIAQNFVGQALPSATLGRINSSLYDIMADGKISSMEVADDFIRSCTNVLDNTAIDMGFPSVSGLYNAIRPDGTGIVSKDFLNNFSKNSQKQTQKAIETLNTQNQNITVLKFKLITDDTEQLNSSIPVRSTENGINLVSNIQNDNLSKDVSVYVVNNESKGVDIYDIKNKIKQIRDSKQTFDIYINDADLKKQEIFENCLFESVSIKVYGKNALQIDFSFSQIPEWNIKTQQLPSGLKVSNGKSNKSGKKTSKKKNTKNIQNNVKTKEKTSVNTKKPMDASIKGTANNIKDYVDSRFAKAKSQGKNYNPLQDAQLQQRTKMNTGYSLEQLGVTSTSSGARYK